MFLFPSAVSAGVFERESVELGISTPGLRSMAISSDGQYLAAGDCQGNLHIYNIHTSEYICVQVNVGTYLKCQNIYTWRFFNILCTFKSTQMTNSGGDHMAGYS